MPFADTQLTLRTQNKPPGGSAGVLYGERGDYRAAYRDGERDFTRDLFCAWEDKDAFVAAMLERAEPDGKGGINRQLPERHPEILNAWCMSCELVEGVGRPEKDVVSEMVHFFEGDFNRHDVGARGEGLARFNVTYRQLPYDVVGNDIAGVFGELSRHVERRPAPNLENLPIPANSFKWVTGGPKDWPERLPVPFPTVHLEYIWHAVPSIPGAAIGQMGTVNDATFDDNSFNWLFFNGYGAGSLLYLAPTIERYPSGGGQMLFTITYHFVYRPTLWNYFWRPVDQPAGWGGGFDELSTDGLHHAETGVPLTTKHVYDSSTFDLLFKL